MASFVHISSPRDQSQESLHLHYPLMLWVHFPQINKFPAKENRQHDWMQGCILGPAFEVCASFFWVGPQPLYSGLLLAGWSCSNPHF